MKSSFQICLRAALALLLAFAVCLVESPIWHVLMLLFQKPHRLRLSPTMTRDLNSTRQPQHARCQSTACHRLACTRPRLFRQTQPYLTILGGPLRACAKPMKTLDFGKHRRARVWIGELPDTACPSVKTLTHTIAADRKSQHGSRMAAIEVFVPLGPRSIYGLLGGHWKPDLTGQLSIDVSVSTPNERLFADSLAMKGVEVRVGLPSEYAKAVLAGVDMAKSELNELTAGKLSINCAAHGIIGSCEAVYKHLARS